MEDIVEMLKHSKLQRRMAAACIETAYATWREPVYKRSRTSSTMHTKAELERHTKSTNAQLQKWNMFDHFNLRRRTADQEEQNTCMHHQTNVHTCKSRNSTIATCCSRFVHNTKPWRLPKTSSRCSLPTSSSTLLGTCRWHYRWHPSHHKNMCSSLISFLLCSTMPITARDIE